MHSYPADILTTQFALAGVNTDANLKTEGSRPLTYRARGLNRPSGPLKWRQSTIAGFPDEPALEPTNGFFQTLIVPIQQLPPPPVSKFRSLLRGPYDIGKQNRRERTVGDRYLASSR